MTMSDATPAVGFITFNPGHEFFDRLRKLAAEGYSVYVFDNSPEVTETRLTSHQLGNVRYMTAGRNVGLGIGFCVLCATAYYDDHAALLFFDQDTGFTDKTMAFIRAFVREHGPTMCEQYVSVCFGGNTNGAATKPAGIQDTLLTISSGSLFSLNNLKSIGWHHAGYFVDCVDYELCLRTRIKGYKTGLVRGTPDFDHESEQPDTHITVLGKRVPMRRYSWFRIRDSLLAYPRLLFYTLRHCEIGAAANVMRSYSIFIAGQILARTPLVKKR